MAVYKIFPEKDASIYTEQPTMNTGLDQILEASTYLYLGNAEISRYLIQFTTSEINNVINNKISGADFKTYLKNYAAVLEGLNTDTTLYFYPVSANWAMGTGHFKDSPIVTNGVSWEFRTSSGSGAWDTSSFGTYITGSYPSGDEGGGTWYTGSNLGLDIEHTQTFSYSDVYDVNVDVTNTVLNWYSHSLNPSNGFENNGFIVKQSDNNEQNVSLDNSPTFRFFSIDTNTIYPPQLEFRWDDYVFNTGSSTNEIINTAESFISIYNNAGIYYSESVARFRVAATPKYPARSFLTGSYYTENYYLPENVSLYAIKDTETNLFVVDFDSTYTKISSDSNSSYFDVYMNGLEPERYYTILIKTTLDGVTKVFDEDIRFKVVKG